MDLGFARRRKAALRAGTPDLASLLAELGARQASSPTARIQARLESDRIIASSASLIDIFAPVSETATETHRFSDLASASAAHPVKPRQST